MEWGESADAAARREVIEETGIRQGVLVNLQWTQVYDILPAFGKVYAPGITRNLEHAFSLRLAQRVPVALSDSEHVRYQWTSGADGGKLASSSTHRAVIESLPMAPGRLAPSSSTCTGCGSRAAKGSGCAGGSSRIL